MRQSSVKQIPMSSLRLGMYIDRLDGSWLEHSFWRTSFALNDADDLERLRQSGIVSCWIDIGKGLDVEIAPAPPAAPVVAAQALPSRATPASASFADELHRAAAVCRGAREAITTMFADARLGRAGDAERCLPLVGDITASVLRNPRALLAIARLKTRDDYTSMHSVAVCALMIALGRELGLDEAACREAGLGGLLHDLGKAMVPLAVLNKPDRLNDEEFALIEQHPVHGHRMLAEGGTVAEPVMDVCLHHHEKIDGSGYPHRLAGDAITLYARMGAVCDVYDAVTSDRPYKAGWDPALSIARMAGWSGHFDAAVFKAFVKSVGIYPTGSLVRLQSGKLAVVVEQNAQSLAAPVVKVFFSTKAQEHIMPRRLDLSQPRCSDRLVGRESREQWGFPPLDGLWNEAR